MHPNSLVLLAVMALCGLAAVPAQSAPVRHDEPRVGGVMVDRYTWIDSKGRSRSVSLKKEGNGNPGHGGYAVQMTYQVPNGASWRVVRVNAAPGEGGFGYFVSHERYRDFDDGSYGTIASEIFGADDSPPGRDFAVAGRQFATSSPEVAAHRFAFSYPRYGTVDPIPKDANGNDASLTPTERAQLALYSLPITILWIFQSGADYPRIQTTIGLGGIPGPDRVNFDVRGPYGALDFDDGARAVIDKVMWGDRYHFQTLGAPLTRNSAWTWNQRNLGARYSALIAGGYEMGLVEPRRWTSSALDDGFAYKRGSRSTLNQNGRGCAGQDGSLPCDWEWPYQSAQYSLPDNDVNAPTSYKKMAWGSVPLYGTGPSLTRTYDTSTTWTAFDGFPETRRISYSVCVVLGQTITGGLTRSVAAGPNYNCATAAP